MWLPYSLQSPVPNDAPSPSGEVPQPYLAADQSRVCF